MDVVLIRHTSVDIPKGTCYGWSDVPLKDTFKQEAKITKQKLEGIVFDKVFSSPLSRAIKLASYCGYNTPTIDDRIKEMNMGDWGMKLFDEIKDDNLDKWYNDFLRVPPTNGESFLSLLERVSSFLDELKNKPYKKVAIFTHVGVIMSSRIYANLCSKEESIKNLVAPGGIEKIQI